MLGGLQRDVEWRCRLFYQPDITPALIPATTKLKSFISLGILHTSGTSDVPLIRSATCVKKIFVKMPVKIHP